MEFLWCEKYRPRTVAETTLPNQLKDTFANIVNGGELPNMMFSGTAGVGKTTIAKALCNELGLDYILVNGSEEGNIDTLRTKIKQFASSISLQGGYKVVILDEADYLNPQSTQPALRGFIEEFSNNCRFILTCNFKNRIIEPLHSRCSVYDFSIPNEQKPQIAAAIFKRTTDILKAENVEFEPKAVAGVVEKYFPDFRRIINEMQRYSVSGRIDAGVLVNLSDESYNSLIKHLKDKNFKEMRKWVANNIDTEPQAIFRKIYDLSSDVMDPASVPQAIITLAEYQYKNAFVADHELNVVACLTEIMASVEWQ